MRKGERVKGGKRWKGLWVGKRKEGRTARTVRNRLKSAGLKSGRVIKRPMLLDRHQRLRLA